MERGPAGTTRRFERIGLCITEDWFALSHFKPLIAALGSVARQTTVIARLSERSRELAALGVEVVDLDWGRRSLGVADQLTTARRLAAIARERRLEALHLVAMKPIVIGSLAALMLPGRPLAFHFTGLGHLFISDAPRIRLARRISMGAVRMAMRKRPWIALAENEDDLADLARAGLPLSEARLLPGAGIDPEEYRPTSRRADGPIVIGCLARMIRSKGIDVLAEAHALLRARGLAVELHLYGDIDPGNPEALDEGVLNAICAGEGVVWHGRTDDASRAWNACDIAVLAARSREGMPRSVLEAAACGKPLVVTDVPGCRHVIRDGIEGFVVPPEDPEALARALERLVASEDLRRRMGERGRARILEGFTSAVVTERLLSAYEKIRPAAVPIGAPRPGEARAAP